MKIKINAPTWISKLIFSPSNKAERPMPTIGIKLVNITALLGSNNLIASTNVITHKTDGNNPR